MRINSQQIKAGDTHRTSGRKRKDYAEKLITTSEDSVYDGRNNLASAGDIIFIVDGKERQGMSTASITLSQYLKLKGRRGKVSNTFLNLPCLSKDKLDK
jgi:translation elongation factor EF-G